MLEFLALLTQRPVVIVLAITGALLVTASSFIAKPEDESQTARRVSIAGYVITGLSVLLFIVAGFLPRQ